MSEKQHCEFPVQAFLILSHVLVGKVLLYQCSIGMIKRFQPEECLIQSHQCNKAGKH